MRGRVAVSAIAASLVGATPASAQSFIADVIGATVGNMAAEEKRHECMSGKPQPASEEAEALTPGNVALRSYWTGVRQGRGDAILAAFHPRDPKARWTYAGRDVASAGLATIRDPVAARAASFDARPTSFKRAGDSASATGIWRATDARGQTAGWYRVTFRRKSGVWKIGEIAVSDAAARPAAITQYCATPGDVEPYLAEIARKDAERAAKKARKDAEREQRDRRP